MNFKLLVNAPSGKQELLQVDLSGGYFDKSRVIWDERVDGAMPSIQLGGMVRSGKVLVVDAAMLAAAQAADAAEKAAKAADEKKMSDARERIKNFNGDTATAAEQKQFMKDAKELLKYL